jgi:flavodoxin
MRAVVLYDSLYGNTEQIARVIAEVLEHSYDVELIRADEFERMDEPPDVLVVGSPTHNRRPSPAMRQALWALERGDVSGVAAAAFDTRYERPRFLTGSAAIGIAKLLKRSGAVVEIGAESFLVEDKEGPLVHGEIERAKRWAHQVLYLVRPNPRVEEA